MPPETTARRRRTQEERSAATREALLDATIAILSEEGYAGLTTTKVAARAGVTRGAQVHHYPSRDALVAAAIARLVERYADAMADTLSRTSGMSLGERLDLLWTQFRGPVFQAVLQLSAASPTEPQIRDSVALLDRTLTRLLLRNAPAILGDAYRPGQEDALFTAFSAMSGLALNYRLVGFDDALLATRWTNTKTQLLRLLTPA